MNSNQGWAFPLPALAHSSAYPAVQYCTTKWLHEGKGTGEQSMLMHLTHRLDVGDVLLADALLATWWIIEAATRRGADVVMAQHGRRLTDFTCGQRLGQHDHVVQWPRPPKPKAMSAEEYARYPQSITMRETEVNGRILVTTLLDPMLVSVRALDALYKMRWNIEVDFRHQGHA